MTYAIHAPAEWYAPLIRPLGPDDNQYEEIRSYLCHTRSYTTVRATVAADVTCESCLQGMARMDDKLRAYTAAEYHDAVNARHAAALAHRPYDYRWTGDCYLCGRIGAPYVVAGDVYQCEPGDHRTSPRDTLAWVMAGPHS